MHINNETGIINDIGRIKKNISDNIFIHTDAVQSFGKIKIDVKELKVNALSASAHKIYGPKGIGFAFVKNGTPMNSLIFGGGQERNRRAGTENVAAIVGFAEAVKLAKTNMKNNFKKVGKLREYFIERLNRKIPNISFNHPISQSSVQSFQYSPYILSFTFLPEHYKVDTEAMLMFLDINGIAASSGSACSSGAVKPSHVILASGKSIDYAKGTLRFSFSPENTFEEVDYSISILEKISEKYKI
jgi:cysteine desulfurase